jgi:hypothetical protein
MSEFPFSPSLWRREIRLGRLRHARRGGRILVLGSWLLQWVKDAEVVRRSRSHAANGQAAASDSA